MEGPHHGRAIADLGVRTEMRLHEVGSRDRIVVEDQHELGAAEGETRVPGGRGTAVGLAKHDRPERRRPSSIETGGSPPSSTTISSNRWGSRVWPSRADTRFARSSGRPWLGTRRRSRGERRSWMRCRSWSGPVVRADRGPTRSGPRRLRPNGRPRHGPAGAIRSRGSGRNDIPLRVICQSLAGWPVSAHRPRAATGTAPPPPSRCCSRERRRSRRHGTSPGTARSHRGERRRGEHREVRREARVTGLVDPRDLTGPVEQAVGRRDAQGACGAAEARLVAAVATGYQDRALSAGASSEQQAQVVDGDLQRAPRRQRGDVSARVHVTGAVGRPHSTRGEDGHERLPDARARGVLEGHHTQGRSSSVSARSSSPKVSMNTPSSNAPSPSRSTGSLSAR